MNNFITYTIFTLFTASACSILEENLFQILVLIYLLTIFLYQQKHVDKGIVIFFTLWCGINLASYLLNRSEDFKMITFLSVSARMLFPYLMLKVIGHNFFKGLFNYWFVLCILGFPFFVAESVDPHFIQSLAPSLNFMTQSEQTAKGGFYVFFYMHSGWAEFFGPLVRNCGFMWEPGAYAAVLIFMIIFHLADNDYTPDWKIGFLALCLLSTFSTSGILSLFFIVAIFIFKNRQFYMKYQAIIPVIIILILTFDLWVYYSTDFLSGKIDSYIERGTKTWQWSFGDQHMTRVSRLGIAIIALENSIVSPWGDGIISSDFVIDKYNNPSGPNSLATILFQWGWPGIIVLLYSLYNFKVKGKKCGFILMIPFLIPLFSNPFAFKSLIYALVFSVLCVPEMKYFVYNNEIIERTDES